MTTRFRAATLAAALLALIGSSACATSINSVLADPSRYRNHEVRISGEVHDSYSLASRGFFRLHDGSGQLWVVSDRGVPRNGARVSVLGTIREGFNLGGLGDRINLPLPAGVASGVVMTEISHKAKR